MKNLTVYSEKCCGCRICEMACSMVHPGYYEIRGWDKLGRPMVKTLEFLGLSEFVDLIRTK